MKTLGIIPARFASTRFPGKPLIDIAGKSMIRRVYEQCVKASRLDKIVVATDDERIRDHVHLFGGIALLTSPDHASGTDRCYEASQHFPDYDICINIQGDEPLIDPGQIDLISRCFDEPGVEIATLVKQITSQEELFNPNTPKVILNKKQEAIYFSRSAIPFMRGIAEEHWHTYHIYYKHIGVYAYRSARLSEITKLAVSSLEFTEGLEQLRWIEHGFKIKAAITDTESQAIDTPEDLEKVLRLLEPE